MTKVLIAAPLRQEKKIFEAYQDALDALFLPAGVMADRFFVVNDCPEIVPEIRSGSWVVRDTGETYQKTGNDHIWTESNMLAMSRLRNEILWHAGRSGYDYVFSVDTDVILRPETLARLLQLERDIVSEIFWTVGPNRRAWCNAWMYDQASGMKAEWGRPDVYRVGMTGACTLISRRVWEAGVDFTPIPNIKAALRGEDRHFCVRAACAGFELWLDTTCPAEHLYTETEYRKWKVRQARREDCGKLPQ